MKRMISTAAVLTAASLFVAPSARAQGHATGAYPPGPTGQAAAQTTSVNVVNTPTVNVGNAVTVKELKRTPLLIQTSVPIVTGFMQSDDEFMSPPAGQRMVIETVNVDCASTLVQAVGVRVFKQGFTKALLTLLPVSAVVGSVLVTGQPYQVHLESDEPLFVHAFRNLGQGNSDCAVTFTGYFTPMPQP